MGSTDLSQVESNVHSEAGTTGEIIGFETDLSHLPPGYYTSKFFIGSMFAVGVLVYNVTLAIALVLVGRLSDIFGRRYFFIGGQVLGVIGSVVCAKSKSVPMLIGGNVLLGIATGPQLSFHFVMGELVPMKYRFLGNAFLYLFCIPGSGVAPNFDYIGTLLFIAGFVVFLLGLSWGGSLYPWQSAAVITAIVGGFAVMAIFVLWEIYAPIKEPLVPMHLFRNGRWVSAVVLLGLGAGVYYAFAIIIPIQVAVLYNSGDATEVGWLSSIVGLGIITGQVISGVLAEPIGKTRYQCMTVFTIGGAFLGACGCITPDNKTTVVALVYIGCVFIGWNETICLANATILVKDQREIGAAGGVAGSVRAAICAVLIAVYTTVLTNSLTKNLSNDVPAALVGAGLPATSVADFMAAITVGTPEAFAKVPGLTASITAVGVRAYKWAYSDAFKAVYLTTIAFSALAVVLTWFAPNTDELMTGKVAATLANEDGHVVQSLDEKKVQTV
ncbi:fungal trichothecene efflux pump-domain-containing protein [Microdochium trichocladiopsis]|uniref:Fungal trichothecene efflux pump-domain-containing protein n=1 Tax=Microdochium trichocladiopsis TaxID=1682393 RepID=A0A9P8Y3D2_9PEZI|nr:fungal trichothecene efflux pump-domain-containing protein [Microdochium trichocladiopsis]KAH7028983.1 fungal trichothecene efflux pump-domain-containing protein [Microdochium trichocladiopsis]